MCSHLPPISTSRPSGGGAESCACSAALPASSKATNTHDRLITNRLLGHWGGEQPAQGGAGDGSRKGHDEKKDEGGVLLVPVAPQQQAYHDEQTDERECRREVFRADAVEPV